MQKDKSQTSITVTAGQVSRSIDRMLRRPQGAPLTKPMLLNDFAAEVMPGKNWGGLLAALSDAPRNPAFETTAPARLAKAAAGLQRAELDSTPVGAVIARFDAGAPILDEPPFLLDHIAAGLVDINPDDNATLVGLCLRVIDMQMRGMFDIDVSLLVAVDGEIFATEINPERTPSEPMAALFRVMAMAGAYDWGEFLASEGIHSGYLVFGPARCVGLIPIALFDALAKGEPVDRLHGKAVRIITSATSDENEKRPDLAWMANMISLALPDLSCGWAEGVTGPFHLDIDLAPARVEARVGPALEDMPARPIGHGTLARPGPGDVWMDATDRDQTFPASDLDYPLGQALNLGLKAARIDVDHQLLIEARVHAAGTGKNYRRHIGLGWRILEFQENAFREWSLSDEAQNLTLRQNIEAWMCRSGFAGIKPDAELPEGSFQMIAPRETYLSPGDWETARSLFGL